MALLHVYSVKRNVCLHNILKVTWWGFNLNKDDVLTEYRCYLSSLTPRVRSGMSPLRVASAGHERRGR